MAKTKTKPVTADVPNDVALANNLRSSVDNIVSLMNQAVSQGIKTVFNISQDQETKLFSATSTITKEI